jgi:hypothetical protein
MKLTTPLRHHALVFVQQRLACQPLPVAALHAPAQAQSPGTQAIRQGRGKLLRGVRTAAV